MKIYGQNSNNMKIISVVGARQICESCSINKSD